eukprot:m.843054 g.843054  ORF g.843054 m.843054 type:complete len:310 (+) comp59531_c0_seq8:723-1652(+)
MCFLDFVEEADIVRATTHSLGQLATSIIANIARRRANEPRDAVLLHVLGHVDAHNVAVVVKQELGQRLGQLRLADSGGAEEQEAAGGLVGAAKASTRPKHSFGHTGHGLFLPNNSLVQLVGQGQQPLALRLVELGHWDAGPPRDHLVDLVGADVFRQHGAVGGLCGGSGSLLQLLLLRDGADLGLGFWNHAVAQVGSPIQLAGSLGSVGLGLVVFEFFLERTQLVDAAVLHLEAQHKRLELFGEAGNLLLTITVPLPGGAVLLFRKRHMASISSCSLRRTRTSISSGRLSSWTRMPAQASSTRSMALSG